MHKCKKHPCPKPETCKCRTVRDANIPVVWIIGGTGSGKQTVGLALHSKYRMDYLSTGELLREEVKTSSRKGVAYERLMAAGRMVDDEEIVGLLEKKMRSILKQSRGYVVNFAKTIAQAELFERFIAPVDLILYVECTDETMLTRAKARQAASGAAVEDADEYEEQLKTKIEQFRTMLGEIQKRYATKMKTVSGEGTNEEVMELVEPLIEEVTARKLAETPKPTCDPEPEEPPAPGAAAT